VAWRRAGQNKSCSVILSDASKSGLLYIIVVPKSAKNATAAPKRYNGSDFLVRRYGSATLLGEGLKLKLSV